MIEINCNKNEQSFILEAIINGINCVDCVFADECQENECTHGCMALIEECIKWNIE